MTIATAVGVAMIPNAQAGFAAAPNIKGGYVAMGDSFSSGEGTFAYDGVTARKGVNECHRGNDGNSWPEIVAAGLKSNPFKFSACSGAEITHFFKGAPGGGNWNEGAQLSDLAKENQHDDTIGLVTFTIGGNDAHFGDILRECVTTDSFAYNNFVHSTSATGCKNAGNKFVTAGINAVKADYDNILDQIHKRAPKAAIRVALYPNLIDPNAGPCALGSVESAIADTVTVSFISKTVMGYLRGWQIRLNKQIAASVNAWIAKNTGVNAKVVDTRNAWKGNQLCSAPAFAWNVNGVQFDSDGNVKPESFHPRTSGNRRTAALILASL